MRKAGISMVALVITIIVLIVLTSAVVITGIGAPKQAQLAVFYSNLDTVQELVTLKMSDNMITGALNGYGENYKWVDIVENYTAEKGRANEPIYFDKYQINGVWLERISPTMLQNNTSLAEGERSKFYVSSTGIVYYEGFVYEGQTLYTKETNKIPVVVANPTDGSFNAEKGVNSPKLLDGMKAVYWNENEEITSDNPDFDYDQWYDYVAQTGTTENGGTSRWANAKTSDGSYWVWVPRYAYSITSGYHTSTAGTIEIEFLKGTATTSSVTGRIFANEAGPNNWNVHPAFTVEGIQLTGIWVAKYEMSGETNGVASTPGNVITTATIKAVSKPGVTSWRSIKIGNCFTNAYNYNRDLESHLMKNSEWGAVAYLTHSKYGRNGTEIAANTSSSYYTGGASGATALTNVLQSTTGNAYGIYDMSGGSFELIATYFHTMQNTNSTGGVLVDAESKYKEVYTSYTETIYGDAMYETSSSGNSGDGSWHGDYAYFSYYLNSSHLFFTRGGGNGNGGSSGMFAFFNTGGGVNYGDSFRVVLWGSLQ